MVIGDDTSIITLTESKALPGHLRPQETRFFSLPFIFLFFETKTREKDGKILFSQAYFLALPEKLIFLKTPKKHILPIHKSIATP